MTNEQIQALKAAAEKAGADEWQAKVISGDGYVIRKGSFRKECGWNTYQPIAEFDDKKVRDFVAAANPAVILSLLADRDADKALIAESVVLFETLRQRIAELEREKDAMTAAALAMRDDMREARTLTVKLPQRQEPTSSGHYGDGYLVPNNSGSALDYEETIDALQEACAAAGITLVVVE